MKDLTPYIPFDTRSPIPYYRQIYEGYRSAILSGRLRPGQRLPSTRSLAGEFGISRLPAVNAFEQLLHEGYIEGRIGAGTYVKQSIPDELGMAINQPTLSGRKTSSKSLRPRNEGLGAFRVSLPALDQFPQRIWSRLIARHARKLDVESMAYGDPAGHAPLREAIAEYLCTSRAVQCDASQVLIVSGSQLALQICAMALLNRGDTICVEEPGYPGARDALTSTGAKLIPVELDEEGIDLTKIPPRAKPRLIYVTPSHQYPLGISMTASRRLELLDWAKRNGSWIIEDDYDSEYRYVSRPLGALQGLESGARVIYIGTFSKILFPSLRLGYIVAPTELFQKFVHLREGLDIFSPTLYQLALTDFILEGHFGRHLRRMRSVYLSRRNALLESLKEYLPFLNPYNADAGLHLSAFLPRGMNDRKIVERASEQEISATALSTCYAGTKSRSGLILGFGGADERRIRQAAQCLGKIISGRS